MSEILIPIVIVGVIGLVAGIGLALASKFMAVPTDETQEKVRECLPGANCGACGYSGCDGYAEAVATGEATSDKCIPGGADTIGAIAAILGVEAATIEPKVAFIKCGGNQETATSKYSYSGLQSCTAANLLHMGPLVCKYGCLGFGDCVAACPFGAITINNGRPVVCEDLCKACGNCVAACPKSLIEIVPKGAYVYVNCSNKDKGAAVAKACSVSCLSCMQCEKNCPNGAIKIVDNRPVVDYSLCIGCGKCKEVCRRKVLL